ncbi:MAG: hypothetical protein QOF60_1992 [Actinomycetota bacterium]|jgi:hypothetical protein|nr:hypothetical protein [Actinomycetota bacterium]
MTKISRILAVVSVLAAVAIAPAAPASAHTTACTGVWTMATPPLFYPGLAAGGSGSFGLQGGTCADGSVPFLNGTITGQCYAGAAVGSDGAHAFSILWAGQMVLSGQVSGTLAMHPDATAGQSCSPLGSGATRWIGTGTLVYTP